jgi:hydroxymethylbilane synthase
LSQSLRVGARASRLSKSQVSIVSNLLKRSASDLELEFIPVKTLGDRRAPAPREMRTSPAGEKGAFTGDIEELLLSGKIDVAIHSMKDLLSELPAGLVIGATPPRGDPRDALISGSGRALDKLPRGARVGTSSLRRKAQLLGIRRDIEVVDLHGNVDTRIRKTLEDEGSRLDAVVLAVAGLERIGESGRISQTFSIDEMVPAVGQGIIAVQMRAGDVEVSRVLSSIDDEATRLESGCERAFAQHLGADCNVPVGGCARVSGNSISLTGVLANEDLSALAKRRVKGPSADAEELGRKLAEQLLDDIRRRGAAAS